jgi:outer membrane receptor protein involved in Fe transport
MNDTASVDLNDIFLYEANTEGAANYTTFSFNIADSGMGEAHDGNAGRSATANRVRGIGAVDRSRNYYPSLAMLPFDKYNTESVEINRGPNSLLFGLGSPAGIVNQTTAIASMTRRFAQVSMQADDLGGYRGSFRANLPLVDKRLGVFVAGLYDERGYRRKPSYDTTRRAYVAVQGSLSRRTSVRASAELFNNHNRRPNNVTPMDMVSAWIEAGRPAWNPYTRTLTYNGEDIFLPASGNTTGLNSAAYPGIRYDTSASIPQMYYDTTRSAAPLLWMQTKLSETGLSGSPNTPYALAVSIGNNNLSKSGIDKPLYRAPGVSDRSLYDWEHVNTLSTNTGTWRGRTYNLEIDHKIAANLFLQLGWYREDYRAARHDYAGGAGLFADPNLTLMDGTANPFFGSAYTFVTSLYDTDTKVSNNNYRLSLAYELDFRKKKNGLSWLGYHRLMALGSRQETDTKNIRHAFIVTDDHDEWASPTNRVDGTNVQKVIRMRYLVGDDATFARAPGGLTLGTMTLPLRWATFTGTPTPNHNSQEYAYTWQDEMTTLGLALSDAGSNHDRQAVDSLSLALQDYWLRDRIVTTFGFRRDRSTSRYGTTPLLLATDGSGFYDPDNLDVFGPKESSSGNTVTAGIVAKPLKWLSLFYNQSENFTAAAARYDLFHNVLPLPTGNGRDYGVRLSLFDNKLVLSVNRFEASSDNARGTAADLYIGRTARIDQLWFLPWARDSAYALYGTGATEEQVNAYVADMMKMPDGAPVPVESTVAGTSTVDADGMEIQLIYNPARNWNMKLTAGQQRARYTNMAPEWNAYNDLRLPVWHAATNESGENFWTSPMPGSTNLVGAWYENSVINAIKVEKANEGKKTRGQREWRASFITTYRFVSGPLKGLDLGGGFRWEDRAVIGYLADAADPQYSLDPDLPVYDQPLTHVDLWAGYNFRCPWLGKKVRARAQVNVRDLTESGGLLPVAVNPDGETSVFRIVDPRQFIFSLTFDF